MITVPARRVKQFGVEFYQAGLSAKDIDRLVKFEVLGYSGGPANEPPKKTRMNRSRVNWDSLEKRIGESEAAYQRPVIRRKIDELVAYYRECKDAATLPAIPGAVIITSERRFTFTPVAGQHDLGLLQIPEEHGVLRVLDGQHRLLALHALSQAGENMTIEVPAVLFDSLDARQIVELFVTINAKHTRLNASHLVSLSGRQLYRDESLAAAHDIVRALNDREDSPLYDEIKLLGVGSGRVAQAPLAQELKKLFAAEAFGPGRKGDAFREESKKFFVNYLKQVAQVFTAAWNGRKYSIKSAAALRAFIKVAPDVVRRLDQEHADRTDFRAIGRVIAPWGRRIGDLRFETEGAWKRSGTTVDSLAKELRLALQYPEGAAV
jgi:DGQHR domain-containing protein